MEQSLNDEMNELLSKHGIQSRCGILLFKYDLLLNRDNVEGLLTIPYESFEELRKCAYFILENSSLSPEEREYLENIEKGNPPAPFKIGAKHVEQ